MGPGEPGALNPATEHRTATMLDTIDQAAGLDTNSPLYALRRQRPEVVEATQASHELFFAADTPTAQLPERFQVAEYACWLAGASELASHYRALNPDAETHPAVAQAMATGNLARLPDARLRQILIFTRTLMLEPAKGDAGQIEALKSAGLTDPDVVTLAQLIGFVSYQLRLVAGLKAMRGATS